MEENRFGVIDLIDQVTIERGVCTFSAPAMQYNGVYNIASVTLAYIIAPSREEYKECVDISELCQCCTCKSHCILFIHSKNKYGKKFFKGKTVELGMPKKGWKQVDDVQQSVLLHP